MDKILKNNKNLQINCVRIFSMSGKSNRQHKNICFLRMVKSWADGITLL
jgi:hypothetical protein